MHYLLTMPLNWTYRRLPICVVVVASLCWANFTQACVKGDRSPDEVTIEDLEELFSQVTITAIFKGKVLSSTQVDRSWARAVAEIQEQWIGNLGTTSEVRVEALDSSLPRTNLCRRRPEPLQIGATYIFFTMQLDSEAVVDSYSFYIPLWEADRYLQVLEEYFEE
jgi:hypothetical protein